VRVVVTLAATVAAHARHTPDAPAFVSSDGTMSWREYHERSDAMAAALVEGGHAPGDKIAVRLPDTGEVHAAFLGIEKAGCTIVGIGSRAGGGPCSPPPRGDPRPRSTA
jgi:acyl-CoA synthetase